MNTAVDPIRGNAKIAEQGVSAEGLAVPPRCLCAINEHRARSIAIAQR
jgi:hypothetical protein